ncbi:unnamed protein product (macronuclear) [Paramecium tetraurelia]|uniref:Trichocyst matrix protein n=1 Tax=Paramecium tetraurelia TaxID=5888 RepID=A0E9R6_PARTE|nr:uncharacterized protein GSPATT00024764001 [Paramecium tetraurelia]CAK92033.1 unnamed protein product [Paramecium tetraurelia]|eukprot:XP_001459430.1 hypothetical protein (macronuclear) [Paramecium tetraurelia strain d4-2]
MRFLIIALVICLATCAKLRSQSPQKLQAELQKSNYGRALLHLLELHSMAGGAVSELVDAIEELVNDLDEGLQFLDFNFQRRTNEHNALLVQLNQQIQQAQIDVSRSEDLIENLLVPRKEQLEVRIETLEEYQAQNRQKVDEENLTREQEHEAYEAQIAELNDATAAVDDALALLSTLNNPSLAQVKKFQNSLKKIEQSIKPRSKMAPFLKALISLASNQNFSDQGVLTQIVNTLNEFRNAIVDSINDLSLQEVQDQENFEARIVQLNAEFAEFQKQINALNVDLTATLEKIDQVTQFRDQRRLDQATYEQQLQLENDLYADEVQIYNDTKNEFQREQAISEQALLLVRSADFTNIQV